MFALPFALQQPKQPRTEEVLGAVVAMIDADPGNPKVWGMASHISLCVPKGEGGPNRDKIDQYVRAVAKSWDDSKSYNPRN